MSRKDWAWVGGIIAVSVLGIAGLIWLVLFWPFTSAADVVSRNVSQSADSFEVLRRVVFYNGITGDYMLTIEGYCSLGNQDPPDELTVTCDLGDNKYKKHFLGLSDNVTYFVEQLNSAGVSKDHYRVIFKPTVIVPDIDVQ